MAAANESLAAQVAAGQDVGMELSSDEDSSDEEGAQEDEESDEVEGHSRRRERKPHIAMEVGLGVLEEKHSSDEDSEDEDEEDGERDILGKLMGADRTEGKSGIQEIPEDDRHNGGRDGKH